MSPFIQIPANEWRLGGCMSTLASPEYERIVKRLVREARLINHWREKAKSNHEFFRIRITLVCSSEAISLFHNANTGYRAQYYSSIARGERANTFALNAMASRICELLNGSEKRTCPLWWIKKSLLDPAAKIWIHQGIWLRSPKREIQNLEVTRWLSMQTTTDKDRQKKAKWSMLTPYNESRLELMGGFLSKSGKSLGSLKESRSKDLHELGFT